MAKKVKKSCIKQTSNYTSQCDGPITRGDMIGFYILMGSIPHEQDQTTIYLDEKTILLYGYGYYGKIKAVDNETGEIIAVYGEQESWYSDWASQPCKWIGPEYFVDDINDIL